MIEAASIYSGRVVHKRLRPRTHAMNYGVFTLLLDVDRIDEVVANVPVLSRNKLNVVSFYDKDFGSGDGKPVGESIRETLQTYGLLSDGQTIQILAYPRVLGYVFNPLTAFFVTEADGTLSTVVYEVSNTFGERMRYVVKAGAAVNGVYKHNCAKKLFVSPFANGAGDYSFRLTMPGDNVRVGILYRDENGPLLKAHFNGARQPLTQKMLLVALFRHPALTWKVISGIHFEALKLWIKGVPLVQGHTSPRFSSVFAPTTTTTE